MSEMTPVGYLVEASDGGRFLVFNDRSMSGPAPQNASELYTAEQLAEAVAAEREKNAKVCEGLMEPDFALPDSWFNNGCKHSAHAIRSAAK